MEPTKECGVLGMGVYPGEGKGEELTPGLIPIAHVGMAGKPASVSEMPMENVSSVHCRDETQLQSHYDQILPPLCDIHQFYVRLMH